jgi:hypothetical protein
MTVNPLAERVVAFSTWIAVAAFVLALLFAILEYAKTPKPKVDELPDAEAQGLDKALEAVAKIGDVLNKATVSVRFMVVGISLMAIAAVAAGADALGGDGNANADGTGDAGEVDADE